MSEPNEIHERVTRLEYQMVDARKDAAAARVLAGAADRDVSEMHAQLRAHTRTLNALRETQLEHGERLAGVEGQLVGVEGRLGGVEGQLVGVEGRLGGVEGQLVGVEGRLGGVEGQLVGVDDRLVGVDGQLGGLERKVDDGFSMVGVGMAQITALLTTEQEKPEDT
jgi:hypothetical protein